MNRRWLWIALVVSLTVNVFVLGGLAGVFLSGWREHHRPAAAGGAPRSMGGLPSGALSAERREAWRAAMRADGGEGARKLRQARMLRRGAWSRLAAEPVDAASVLSDLEKARALEMEGRGALDARIVEFARQLPPDERMRLAEGLANQGQRPGPGGRARGAGSGGGGPAGERQSGLPDR